MNWILDPFLHKFGTGVFPEPLYSKLLKNLPPLEVMKVDDPLWREKYPSGPRRFSMEISEEISKYLKLRFANKEDRIQVRLYCSMPGFQLWPHTDFPEKKETTVIYLTEKELPNAGTALYEQVKPFPVEFDPRAIYDPVFFKLVKIAPFVPNGFMTFQRSDKSWHGVEPCPFERWAIYFTRYGDIDANQRSIQETERRAT